MPGTVKAEANRVLIETANTYFNAHEWDHLIALDAESVLLESPELPEPARGRDAHQAYIEGLVRAFPDIWIRIANLFVERAWGCEEFVITGTNTGPLIGPKGESIPATGRRIRVKGCLVARVEAGKIVELHQYFDRADLAAQLGVPL